MQIFQMFFLLFFLVLLFFDPHWFQLPPSSGGWSSHSPMTAKASFFFLSDTLNVINERGQCFSEARLI